MLAQRNLRFSYTEYGFGGLRLDLSLKPKPQRVSVPDARTRGWIRASASQRTSTSQKTERTEDECSSPYPPSIQRRVLLSALSLASVSQPDVSEAEPFCGVVGGGALPGWAYQTPFDEYYVDFMGSRTFVRSVGRPPSKPLLPFAGGGPPKAPLLVLHGGAGLSSTYLESLELLAAEGRQIVFYDQLGCGRSRQAGSGSRPNISLGTAVEQLAAVRSAAGLGQQVHILGHGFGGMLALEALRRPEARTGVLSLTLVSTAPSTAALVADRLKCVESLPAAEAEELLRLDELGEAATSDAAAASAYLSRFVNREPRGCFTQSRAKRSPEVFDALQGRRLFSAAGEMSGWDATGTLRDVDLPTLAVRGDSDEVSMDTLDQLVAGMPRARGLVCPGSGSCCHLDNPEALLQEANDHMERAETARA